MVIFFRTQNNSSGKLSAVFIADVVVLLVTVLGGSLWYLASGAPAAHGTDMVLFGGLGSLLILLTGRLWGIYHRAGYRPLGHITLDVVAVVGIGVLGASALVYGLELLRGSLLLPVQVPISLFLLGSASLLLLRLATGQHTPHALLSVPLQPHPLARRSRSRIAATREQTHPATSTVHEDQIRQAVQGRRVMIFGADTPAGSAFAHLIAGYAPESLVLQGQHEQQVAEIYEQLRLHATPEQKHRIFAGTADLRMADRLAVLVQNYRPELVIHAGIPAATPISAADPVEVVASVVLGTRYLLRAVNSAEVARTVVVVPWAQPVQQPLLAACQHLVIVQATHASQPSGQLVVPVQQMCSESEDTLPDAAEHQIRARHILHAALDSQPYTLVVMPASTVASPLTEPITLRRPTQLEVHLDHLAQGVYHGNSEEVLRVLQQLVPDIQIVRVVGQVSSVASPTPTR